MSVNAKDKAALQKNWDDAEAAKGSELPDGTYQFQVIKKTGKGDKTGFALTGKDKPVFKTALKVVGGDEEYMGQELYINDNLETAENMGWFKRKLSRLNVPLPEDISELTDGEVADAMIGKKFEGQVKTKNDFMNVYVNRLLGEAEGDDEEDDSKGGESKEIEEGDRVKWKSHEGVVVRIKDDGTVVFKDDEGEKWKADKDDVKIVEADEDDEDEDEDDDEDSDDKEDKKEEDSEDDDEDEDDEDEKKEEDEDEEDEDDEDEDEDDEEFVVPEPDDVVDMPASKVKAALKTLGIKAEKVKNPRAVLKAFCTLAHDDKAKLDMSEISPLASALGVELEKGQPIKETLKQLAKAVQKKLG
jgi:hypothetical protein